MERVFTIRDGGGSPHERPGVNALDGEIDSLEDPGGEDRGLSRIRRTMAALGTLEATSPDVADSESTLDAFSRFALGHFPLDSFGICALEPAGFRTLVFTDRQGRDPDTTILESCSPVARALLLNSLGEVPPPPEWFLQKRNRWAGYWPLNVPDLPGFVYAGSDSPGDAFAGIPEIFAVFKARIDGFLREHYLASRHRQQQRRLFIASIHAHARSIEAKDAYTAGHCDRVERYAELLARQAGGFSEEWIFNLRVGAILHDIGKIGVPSALLCKPGALSHEEQNQVQSHPVIGSRIVRGLEGFNLESSVRSHHEFYDGSGYPDGLRGNRIPIEARLILAADTFDAMTSNRPYRRALSTARAIEELKKFSGKQFDPEVVRLMMDAAPVLEEARMKSAEIVNPLMDLTDAV